MYGNVIKTPSINKQLVNLAQSVTIKQYCQNVLLVKKTQHEETEFEQTALKNITLNI